MPASIWLQPIGEQREMLRSLIAALARRHGTAGFAPHLTACSARDLHPARIEAAADYIRRCDLLPLAVRKTSISYSATAPFRAVVIEIQDSSELRSFRDDLQRVIGGGEPGTPHISLLYTIDENGERLGWWSDATRLRAIADECAAQIEATEFVLDHPAIVAPDGDWTNIATWKVVRKL